MKRLLIIIFIFFFNLFVTYAQPGDPGGGGNPGDVPITGIEILIAIGGALGFRKIYLKQKSKSEK